MASPRADCEYCGQNVKKKALTLVHGVQCCWRCKRKGSFYSKKVYAPLLNVDRKRRGTHGIDFSHADDADVKRLVESLRRPLNKKDKSILYGEYKRRGIGELEAKERIKNLETGLATTKAIKRINNKSVDKKIDFQAEFKKLIERRKSKDE